MKILIAIASCQRDIENGFNQAVRETWMTEIPADVDCRFFVGETATPRHADEIQLPCPDDYLSLPEKTHHLMRWSLFKNGYTHTFKCDTDTYVKPSRMLASDFAKYDYVGHFNGAGPNGQVGVRGAVYENCYAWASGGAGYWLSSKAAEHIANKPPDERYTCPRLGYPCEDLGVGQIMGALVARKLIKAKHDTRYGRSYRDNFLVNFTAHYCSEGMSRKFDTSWMFSHHEANS